MINLLQKCLIALRKEKIQGLVFDEKYYRNYPEGEAFSQLIGITDINNDGVLKGPNFINILKYKNLVKVPLIASGGVSSFHDIKKLYSFNVDGVIIVKAIYDNKVNLNEIFSLKKNVKN